MTSRLFATGEYQRIERDLARLLSGRSDIVSERGAQSPRAVGDAIQQVLSQEFASILGDLCANYSASFARRAMADLAFHDVDGLYYVVDVKTHRHDAKFSMPNLTSVERLARLYEDDENYFVILMVNYEIHRAELAVSRVHFVPIEYLDWNCLTIGALGWGQIQLADSKNLCVNAKCSRRTWMLALCDSLAEFYPREIAKIDERRQHFAKVREFWQAKVVG